VPVPTTIITNQTVDRIDQNIGDKIRLYARADYQNEAVFGGNAVPTNSATTPVTDSNYTVGYTETLTANLVNDLRVGRNYFSTATLNPFSVSKQTSASTDLGIPGFTDDSIFNNPGIPNFNITGFNGLANGSTNWYQNDSTTQLSEQISWNHHSHNIMAGMEFRRLATGRAAVNSARGQWPAFGVYHTVGTIKCASAHNHETAPVIRSSICIKAVSDFSLAFPSSTAPSLSPA